MTCLVLFCAEDGGEVVGHFVLEGRRYLDIQRWFKLEVEIRQDDKWRRS